MDFWCQEWTWEGEEDLEEKGLWDDNLACMEKLNHLLFYQGKMRKGGLSKDLWSYTWEGEGFHSTQNSRTWKNPVKMIDRSFQTGKEQTSVHHTWQAGVIEMVLKGCQTNLWRELLMGFNYNHELESPCSRAVNLWMTHVKVRALVGSCLSALFVCIWLATVEKQVTNFSHIK